MILSSLGFLLLDCGVIFTNVSNSEICTYMGIKCINSYRWAQNIVILDEWFNHLKKKHYLCLSEGTV